MPATRGVGFYPALCTAITRLDDEIWLCIGQADAWGGDTPPEDNTEVPNPILYKRCTGTVKLVKQVAEGEDYDYRWTTLAGDPPAAVVRYFKIVTESDVITNSYHIFFLQQYIDPGDGGLAEITYRAAGFYQGLTPAVGHEADNILLPANVTNVGNLLIVQHYDAATEVSGDGNGLIQIAIEIK